MIRSSFFLGALAFLSKVSAEEPNCLVCEKITDDDNDELKCKFGDTSTPELNQFSGGVFPVISHFKSGKYELVGDLGDKRPSPDVSVVFNFGTPLKVVGSTLESNKASLVQTSNFHLINSSVEVNRLKDRYQIMTSRNFIPLDPSRAYFMVESSPDIFCSMNLSDSMDVCVQEKTIVNGSIEIGEDEHKKIYPLPSDPEALKLFYSTSFINAKLSSKYNIIPSPEFRNGFLVIEAEENILNFPDHSVFDLDRFDSQYARLVEAKRLTGSAEVDSIEIAKTRRLIHSGFVVILPDGSIQHSHGFTSPFRPVETEGFLLKFLNEPAPSFFSKYSRHIIASVVLILIGAGVGVAIFLGKKKLDDPLLKEEVITENYV